MSGNLPAVVDDPQLKKPPVVQIYEKLRDLFGNGQTDIFQMEFPARLLEQGNYDYVDSDSLNAQQIKPPAVTEAEFRLADDMFSISSMVGGPNGGKVSKTFNAEIVVLIALQLSDAYREVLFQLLPSHTQGMSTNDDKVLVDQVSLSFPKD